MLTRLSLLQWLSQTFSRQNCKGEECVVTRFMCHKENEVRAVGKDSKTVNIVEYPDCTAVKELVLDSNSCRSLVTLRSHPRQYLQK